VVVWRKFVKVDRIKGVRATIHICKDD
jgi:hypothetical protein